MENITKINWINNYKDVEVEEDKTLEQMILEMKESAKKYAEESKIFNENMNNQLAEIKSLVKYTLTEQEEQRISQMSMSELLIEMQKNVEDIKSTIHKLGGDR